LARLARPRRGAAARQAGLTMPTIAAVVSRLAGPARRAVPSGDRPAGTTRQANPAGRASPAGTAGTGGRAPAAAGAAGALASSTGPAPSSVPVTLREPVRTGASPRPEQPATCGSAA
jgi:hypothetical protein